MAALLLVTLASCVGPPAQPAPVAPVPMAAPRPRPALPPQPALGWQDTPLAPGVWRWSNEGGRSTARYGQLLTLACTGGGVRLTLAGAGATNWMIDTSSTSRALTASLDPATGLGRVTLAAGDPLLDAMAFSRGRFAVELPGRAPLALPAWPEVARVIDDCRRPVGP